MPESQEPALHAERFGRALRFFEELIEYAANDVTVGRRVTDKLVIMLSRVIYAPFLVLCVLLKMDHRGTRVTPGRVQRLWRTSLLAPVQVDVERAVFAVRPHTSDILVAFRSRRLSPEPEVIKFLLSQSPRVFVDVGANIGLYSILAARRAANDGRVIAFEPEASNYKQLLENLAKNECNNVMAVRLAASSEDSLARLWSPADGTQTGLFSLKRAGSHIKRSSDMVRAARLDGVLRGLGVTDIDLVKIDTEGTEPDVLIGLGSYLDHCRFIVFEAWDAAHLDQCKFVLGDDRYAIRALDAENYLASRI